MRWWRNCKLRRINPVAQRSANCWKAWLLVMATFGMLGCLNTTASCVERNAPDNTCYASYYIENSADCAKVPGCSTQPICVPKSCDAQSVRNAADAGVQLICHQSDQVDCGLLSDANCALNQNCIWTSGCGGTPTVDCASIKSDVACMAYPVCFWQISGT